MWPANTRDLNLVDYCICGTGMMQKRVYQVPTRKWANAQRDGRPAEHKWRPLFNAANFG